MQAKFYKQISALGMLHMYWQWCISDSQCGFNQFIESYYMVQCVLPIVYPILFTGSMNSLNPYHMTQCVHLVAHIIWYTVTSLCGCHLVSFEIWHMVESIGVLQWRTSLRIRRIWTMTYLMDSQSALLSSKAWRSLFLDTRESIVSW